MSKRLIKIKKNNRDNWENTDKTQTSLAMGSPEYRERQRDLYQNSAEKPDDKFHLELEGHNEVQASDVSEKNRRRDEQNDTSERKYRNQTAKQVQYNSVKSTAVAMAAATKTPVDDIKAKRMMPKNLESIVYNDGVSEDDYLPSALKKYL